MCSNAQPKNFEIKKKKEMKKTKPAIAGKSSN